MLLSFRLFEYHWTIDNLVVLSKNLAVILRDTQCKDTPGRFTFAPQAYLFALEESKRYLWQNDASAIEQSSMETEEIL